MSGLNYCVKKIALFLVIPEVVSRRAKESIRGKQSNWLKAQCVEARGEYVESLGEVHSLSIQVQGDPGDPQVHGRCVCGCVWEEGRMRAEEQETWTWKRSWEVGIWLCGLHMPISQHNLNLILKDANGKMEMKRFFLLLLWLK